MAASRLRRPNERLRTKRRERGLTQLELAEELTQLRWQQDQDAPDVTEGMVSHWERGRRPRPHHRRLLAEFFGGDAEELGLRLAPMVADNGAPTPAAGYDEGTKRRTFLAGAAGTVAGLAGAVVADPLLTAMNRLNAQADLKPGSSRTLANLVLEKNSSYFILFSLPRTTVRADVIEFVPDIQPQPPPGETRPYAEQ